MHGAWRKHLASYEKHSSGRPWLRSEGVPCTAHVRCSLEDAKRREYLLQLAACWKLFCHSSWFPAAPNPSASRLQRKGVSLHLTWRGRACCELPKNESCLRASPGATLSKNCRRLAGSNASLLATPLKRGAGVEALPRRFLHHDQHSLGTTPKAPPAAAAGWRAPGTSMSRDDMKAWAAELGVSRREAERMLGVFREK